MLHEVPTIVDLLAEDFVGTTLPLEDAPPVRVLITSGSSYASSRSMPTFASMT
ncbi:MAG: hypothetical protein KY452_09200 [Actinobacteria bacterium]|nr:hypothetical protein [Actinomycetota bacterium]